MSLFSPDRPRPAPSIPQRGERGTRGLVPEPEPGTKAKRRERKNRQEGLKPRGFLLGSGTHVQDSRWYYDLDGKYVRVRGKKWIVELFGPHRALAALTEDERAAVMNARQNARRNGRLGEP